MGESAGAPTGPLVSRPRHTGLVLLAALALVGAMSLPASAAHAGPDGLAASDGLAVSGHSRYVLDAQHHMVSATMTVDLTNQAPNIPVAGGYQYFVWRGFTFVVPKDATHVVATSDGSSLPVAVRAAPGSSTQSLAKVSFANLRYGHSRRITLTFTLPGAPARSADPTRVGPGYATFEVWCPGDPGKANVEVVLPAGMELNATTDDLRPGPTTATTQTYVSTTMTSANDFWAIVSARDLTQTSTSAVTVGPTTLTLKAWPGDNAWSSFVRNAVTQGLPQLERLVGLPWPGQVQSIREDARVYVAGYDGWYDTSRKEIVIGESLDDSLVYHELSHAWMSHSSADERWIYEGLAQFLSDRVAATTKVKPGPVVPVQPSTKNAVRLNEWTDDSSDGRSSPANEYAYPASREVMRQILSPVPDAKLTPTLKGIATGESAYERAGVTNELGGVRTGWQRFLDLVEVRAGATNAAAVLKTWALTPAQAAAVPARAAARAKYAELDHVDGTWEPPMAIRAAMTDWQFTDATALIDKAAPLATAASAVQQTASRTGLPVPPSVQSAYEELNDAKDFAPFQAQLTQTAGAMTTVAAALESSHAATIGNPLDRLGAALQGAAHDATSARADLAAGRIPAATRAANQASAESSRATVVGAAALVAALLMLIGGFIGGRRLAMRPAQSVRSIRVLPKVLGLTRSRSRNSATPSS